MGLPALAGAAPGDLLVTSADEGAVYEFSSGSLVLFATGLSLPAGLCVGPDGEIYVAEAGSGQVTIITAGGGTDFTDAPGFIDVGGTTPVGMLCSDDSLILSTWQGTVTDTPDGIPGPIDRIAVNLPAGGDMAYDASGNILVADVGQPTVPTPPGIYDLSMAVGGDMAGVSPVVASPPILLSIEAFDDMLLGGELDEPSVWDFTDLNLSGDTPWATLPDNAGGVQGLLDAGDLGLFALVGDEIYEISAGGDLTGATAHATGLSTGQYGYQGMLHHVCSADADCDDADACNGAEACVSNACVAEPLDCDDDDVCTADSCDAASGCVNDTIDGCCVDDFDCAISEVCDAGTNQCVPTDPTGGPGDGSESGDGTDGDDDGNTSGDPTSMTATAPTAGADSGSGSDTDGGPEGDGEDAAGCSCRGGSGHPGGLVLLGVALLGFRRRGY